MKLFFKWVDAKFARADKIARGDKIARKYFCTETLDLN